MAAFAAWCSSASSNPCQPEQFQLLQASAIAEIMNPNHIKGIKEKCDYFCSNEKVRYAKGFMCTINALTVRVANTFRYRMIGYLGRKNYYLKRSGKLALTPAEQQWIINTAKELGVIQSEYFDSYIVDYNWDR